MGYRYSRREFCLSSAVAALSPTALSCGSTVSKKERPNILWITSEDNSPLLGCYGDDFADTPNLDRLASEGVLYENAFANAPVCAPARNTLITGMYACSLGTHNMRSANPIPADFKFFTQCLRESGYYCSNRRKEDYNTIKPDGAWDDSSREATWKNRAPGQPFFSVFNHTVSHESCLHRIEPTVHDPAKVTLPPYHPDTPEIRRDWAQYYDKVTALDRQVGELLAELDRDGLAEDTIVFYYADHGGVLTRSKRFLYDSGTHVPLIIRFPEKFRHLAPSGPGTKTDRLVSFVDFGPTVLSLAGVDIPANMQGEAFLGAQEKPERDYVGLFRGRMDERIDMMRAVRDRRYKYIRNYYPHRPWGQHLNYLWRMKTTQVWERMYLDGKTAGPQNYFFQQKPAEELYDTLEDPHEVENLARNMDYADKLQEMRAALKDWIFDIRDAGYISEGEMIERSAGEPPYTMTHDPERYDLDTLFDAAEKASNEDPAWADRIIGMLTSGDSGIRYWGMQGCLMHGQDMMAAREAVRTCLNDSCPDVRISAAEWLCSIGEMDPARQVLADLLDHANEWVCLHAANVLDYLGEDAKKYTGLMREHLDDKSGYIQRVMQKALTDLGEKFPNQETWPKK